MLQKISLKNPNYQIRSCQKFGKFFIATLWNIVAGLYWKAVCPPTFLVLHPFLRPVCVKLCDTPTLTSFFLSGLVL